MKTPDTQTTAAVDESGGDEARAPLSGPRAAARRWGRELSVLAAFLALTALMTWPWVTRMHDAVADEGDPYMLAWTLWWDYHQTFSDPLNLFHANVFYPYRYTLAFSEHDYGIALLFFPLFAAGVRPLSVHSFATFCGFAFSGYGAFRLARTLTGSNGAGWVAGVFYAFIPHRFHLLSHLHYLFAGWVPLLLEALVLFARARTRRRAAWLGVAFLMNALTCVTYFILTLLPLALSAALLLTRERAWRDRDFWVRGGAALGAASLALLPFMLPYHYVRQMHGFTRSAGEVAFNSPTPAHWLVADARNKLWRGFGGGVADGARHPLFPGLLVLLLSLAAWLPARISARRDDDDGTEARRRGAREKLLLALDASAVVFGVFALLAAGYEGSSVRSAFVKLLDALSAPRLLSLMVVALVVRAAIAYPAALRRRGGEANLIASIRAGRRGDAFALGLIWTACGFLGSLGMNFFLNRALFDLVPLFAAIRIPSHWAMIAYAGLAVLAGLGALRLSERAARFSPRLRPALVFAALVLALLFELRAVPLRFVRGKADPDEITLRLKETPMRGGLLELPFVGEQMYLHRYMLRSADHRKPLVHGISSFVSPAFQKAEEYVNASPIDPRLLDLLEELPVSYLVVHSALVPPERRADYETFLSQGLWSGRLRFVRSHGDRDDLYAVVKTEPGAVQEAPPPFAPVVRGWDELLDEDPVNVLGQHQEWSQAVYRLHVASFGTLPRFDEFLTDVRALSRGVTHGLPGQEPKLKENLSGLAQRWVERGRFQALYKKASNREFVERLLANAGLAPGGDVGAALVNRLDGGEATRAEVLLEVVNHPRFAERERNRALVLLHYFGYLRRNPSDPPDDNTHGFDYWVTHLDATGDRSHLSRAFMASGEYKDRKK